MEIVSALFVENFNMRQVPGPSTRIDISGVFFSTAAPSPAPVSIEPHLLALIWCPDGESGQGVFETIFTRGEEEVARNVSPFTVEPGKFTYRLVRGQLHFDDYGTVVANCRIDRGPWHPVPLTLLPPEE
jgi:hypothetical protein